MAIRLSVCLLICWSVCRIRIRPLSTILLCDSLWSALCSSIAPRCDPFPEETSRRLICGWARVKPICFSATLFWQWYWWMAVWKMSHGTASGCNLALVLWNPNESRLSGRAGRFYQADQCKHVKRRACIMHPCICLCGHTLHAAWSVCVVVCMTEGNVCMHTIYLNVKLHWHYHIPCFTAKSDHSLSTDSSHRHNQQSLFVLLLM